MNYRGIWNEDTEYSKNDVVTYPETKSIYRCKGNGVTELPTDINKWVVLRAINIVAYIIKQGLSLNEDQVWLYNQDYIIPPNPQLSVMIQFAGSQPFGNNNRATPTEAGMAEEMSLQAREEYIINIFSKDDSAQQRKEDVILALNSFFATTWQAIGQFKLPRISNSFVNISDVEGPGMLNRFAINIALLTGYYKKSAIDFYDKFSTEGKVEITENEIFEFENQIIE
jgi:hypothetical protein